MACAVATIYDDYIALPSQHQEGPPRKDVFPPLPAEYAHDGPSLEEWKLLEEMYWEGLAEMAAAEAGDSRGSSFYKPIPMKIVPIKDYQAANNN